MKITKQLIKKFENSEVTCRLINGWYKEYSVVAEYSNGWNWKLTLKYKPDLLRYACGSINDKEYTISLLEPTSKNSGNIYCNIPCELQSVVDMLYSKVDYTEEEQKKNINKIIKAFEEFY